jgi:hypothetical protein
MLHLPPNVAQTSQNFLLDHPYIAPSIERSKPAQASHTNLKQYSKHYQNKIQRF